KIRAVPINVSYRCVENELLYVYRDSDSVALLYDVEFEDRVAATVPEAPALKHLIAVGGRPSIPGAVAYEDAVREADGTRGFPARSADDLYIIYTGGTTGVPKGVLWTAENPPLGLWNPPLPRPARPAHVGEDGRNGGRLGTPP